MLLQIHRPCYVTRCRSIKITLMQATDTDLQQLFHAFKLGISRAVFACTPRSDLDDLERVTVTLDCAAEVPHVTSAPALECPCGHACLCRRHH